MKLVKVVIIVIVLLLVIAGGALFYFKDAAVRRGVITGGDMVLGQGSTQLDGASLGLFSGSLSLSGFSLDNAEGFKQPQFFNLDQTDVRVTLGSLASDKVVVPEVTLDGLEVVAELTAVPPRLNLIKIKKTIDEAVGTPGEPEPEEPAEDAEGKKFVIEKLTVTNAQLTFAGTIPGGASMPAGVKLPDFTLEGIGEKENGVVLKEVIGIVLDAVLRRAIEAVGEVGGIGLDTFEGFSSDVLQGVGGLGGETGEAVGDALRGVGGMLNRDGDNGDADQDDNGDDDGNGDGDAVGDALRGVGGMLNRDGDNDDEDNSNDNDNAQ